MGAAARVTLLLPRSHRLLVSSPSSSALLSLRRIDWFKPWMLKSASITMLRPGLERAPSIAASSCKDPPSSLASDADSTASASSTASSAIQFLLLCQRLKTTKRAGWVNHGVEHPESIADHMHRMAIMAIIANDIPGINKDRCVKMAVVHDIAEAVVGDITPADNIPKEEKSRRERAAIDDMCNMLGKGFAVDELRELWNEYEMNSSPEAKLIKDFDKVEMILQALEYETTQGKDLEEFFSSTAGKFQTDIGRAWAKEIISRRNRKARPS